MKSENQDKNLKIPQEFFQVKIPLKERIYQCTKWYLKTCTKNPDLFSAEQKNFYDEYMNNLTRNLFVWMASPLMLRFILRKTSHANKLTVALFGLNSFYYGFQIYQNHLNLNNFVFQEFIN